MSHQAICPACLPGYYDFGVDVSEFTASSSVACCCCCMHVNDHTPFCLFLRLPLALTTNPIHPILVLLEEQSKPPTCRPHLSRETSKPRLHVKKQLVSLVFVHAVYPLRQPSGSGAVGLVARFPRVITLRIWLFQSRGNWGRLCLAETGSGNPLVTCTGTRVPRARVTVIHSVYGRIRRSHPSFA
ncbi:hypothetical protein LZ30DRAFT_336809 [Colletotrichum cereale]|nr:hypothetical protein LZ30DRAFT_336809 [Colletotrichum cereale]